MRENAERVMAKPGAGRQNPLWLARFAALDKRPGGRTCEV